ncbi:MAG: hypothetical protein ACPIOQ_84815, partial [Promethearchaeia archaeon]
MSTGAVQYTGNLCCSNGISGGGQRRLEPALDDLNWTRSGASCALYASPVDSWLHCCLRSERFRGCPAHRSAHGSALAQHSA